MIFQPYSITKDSEVEYIGEIPAQWTRCPIKKLARQGYKTFTDGDWIESPYITQEGVRLIQTGNIGIGIYKEQGFRYISKDTFADFCCTEIDPGDVLICRLADPVGRACIAPDLGVRMITSVDVSILKPCGNHDARFIVYFLSSDVYLSWLQALCRGGTRDRVSRTMLGDINIPVPPLDEQKTIASFLDHKTALIDDLIAKREHQIELLQGHRTAIISRAVTKGLNSDVPMKDSGIEWLGKIPAHWETCRLRYLGYCQNGINIGAEKFGTGYPFVSYGDVYNNSALPVVGSGLVESSDADRTRYSVETGDVFFTRTSETMEEIGFSSVCFKTISDAVFAGFLIRFRPIGETLNIGFSEFYFRSDHLRAFFVKEMNLVTRASLSQDLLKDVPVLLPPIDEQAQIASMLNKKIGQITSLIQKIQNSITKLQEHRTALISTAVTGKIDVRSWKPSSESIEETVHA